MVCEHLMKLFRKNKLATKKQSVKFLLSVFALRG